MNAHERVGSKDTARLIGTILVEAGRLDAEDAERVNQLQDEQGIRFGEAAIRLGLLSAADIEFALSTQFGYTCLTRGESKVSERLVAAYAASGPELEALRALRSQLIQRWFNGEPGRKALAVVSAGRNEGRSFIAANLAVVFSRLGQLTLLIDADLRHPSQHELLGIDNGAGLSTVLAGRARHEVIQPIPALPALSVLTAGAPAPNPQELLSRSTFAHLLKEIAPEYSLILLDTSSADECTDGHTVALRAGGALVVVRKDITRASATRGVCDSLAQAGAAVVGTVLNDF